MKFFVLNTVLAAGCMVALAAAPLPAFANGTMGNDYTITIHNDSNRTIDGIFATNTDNTDWGVNLISGGLLPRHSIDIDVDDYSGYCIFDVQARGPKGAIWEWDGVNVCNESDLYADPNSQQ